MVLILLNFDYNLMTHLTFSHLLFLILVYVEKLVVLFDISLPLNL